MCLYVYACLYQCVFESVLLPLWYFHNNGCGGQGIYLWELQSTMTLFHSSVVTLNCVRHLSASPSVCVYVCVCGGIETTATHP